MLDTTHGGGINRTPRTLTGDDAALPPATSSRDDLTEPPSDIGKVQHTQHASDNEGRTTDDIPPRDGSKLGSSGIGVTHGTRGSSGETNESNNSSRGNNAAQQAQVDIGAERGTPLRGEERMNIKCCDGMPLRKGTRCSTRALIFIRYWDIQYSAGHPNNV